MGFRKTLGAIGGGITGAAAGGGGTAAAINGLSDVAKSMGNHVLTHIPGPLDATIAGTHFPTAMTPLPVMAGLGVAGAGIAIGHAIGKGVENRRSARAAERTAAFNEGHTAARG